MAILLPFDYNDGNREYADGSVNDGTEGFGAVTKLTARLRQYLREGENLDIREQFSERQLIRTLMMLICDEEDIVRQRACRELAEIMCRMAPSKIENSVRRLLWRLNPESGDHPIGLPELLGEIGYRAPEQIKTFVSVILYYLDDEKLKPGLLQAAGRIGERLPDVLSEHISEISECLHEKDIIIAANAVLALSRIGGGRAEEALRLMEHDEREVTIICGDERRTVKLCELAKQKLEEPDRPCFIAGSRLG